MTVFRTQPSTAKSAFNPHGDAVVIEAFQKGHDGLLQNVPALTVRKMNDGRLPFPGPVLQQIAENLETVLNDAGTPPHQIPTYGHKFYFQPVEDEKLVYIRAADPRGGVTFKEIEISLRPEASEETCRDFFERVGTPGVMQAFCAAIAYGSTPGAQSNSKPPAARL